MGLAATALACHIKSMADCLAEAAARRHGVLPQVAWAFPERDALGI